MSYAACDNAPLCQRVAQSDIGGGPMHLFSDLCLCIPVADQKEMKALQPRKGASSKVCKAAYQKIRTYLEEHRERIWAEPVVTCCLKHPAGLCRAIWKCPQGISESQRPMSVSFSGPMCTPWTSQGLQRGDADQAMVSFHVWITKMMSSDHDVIWFQNSGIFFGATSKMRCP